MSQIKNLGTEKITPDNTDIIPIQQANGMTRYITRENFLSGIGVGSSLNIRFIQLTHTRPSATNGGAATFSTWTDRPINTIDFDETNQVTLLNNSFVLPPGIYYVEAKSTFYGLGDTKLRLYNKITNTSLLQGLNGWVNPAGSVALPLFLNGKFTIAANQSLALQYWARNTSGSSVYNYGGSVFDGTPEKYASIDLWKMG